MGCASIPWVRSEIAIPSFAKCHASYRSRGSVLAVGEGDDLLRQNFAERINAYLPIRRNVGKFRIALQHRSVFERQHNFFRDGDVDFYRVRRAGNGP